MPEQRKPPTNVFRLIAAATERLKGKTPPKAPNATVANRIRLRKATPPPNNGKGKKGK